MRLMKTLPVSVLLLALGAIAADAQSSLPLELPNYTEQQRWDRAAVHAISFPIAMVSTFAADGKTAADAGRALFDVFGPGWTGVDTPQQFAVSLHRNWLLWPAGHVEIVEQSENRVVVRGNRPWSGVFGDNGTSYGVTLADMDTFFMVFHQLVANQQGMNYHYTTDDRGITITISAR